MRGLRRRWEAEDWKSIMGYGAAWLRSERWRLAGWLGGVSRLRDTRECFVSCQTWGETPPGQPARRQRSGAKSLQRSPRQSLQQIIEPPPWSARGDEACSVDLHSVDERI